jgi:hypothetical protein
MPVGGFDFPAILKLVPSKSWRIKDRIAS